MVNQQVRIRMYGQILECFGFASCRRRHRRRVAAKAGIFRARTEDLLPPLGAGGKRRGLWRIKEPHKDREHLPVRKFMKRIEETLVANVGRFAPENVVWFAFV